MFLSIIALLFIITN